MSRDPPSPREMGLKTHSHEAAEPVRNPAESAEQAAHGAGVQAIHGLLARGRPDPREVAALIAQFRGDTSAMFSVLHQAVGNRFVSDVIASTQAVAPAVAPTSLGDLGSPAEPDHDSAWRAATDQAKTEPAPASAKDLAAADELLKLSPVGTRGPSGKAAFLVAAIDRGFVLAYPGTKTQLQQFVDNKSMSIHSDEQAPYEKPVAARKPGEKTIEEAGKEVAAKKGLKIDGTRGHYDVEIDQSTILDTLVAVARTRIQRWRDAGVGKKRSVLSLGNFVRGDPGYGGSVHTVGKAIDTAFLGHASNEDEAIALLEDLPPGPREWVFPDGAGVHINNHGNGYDFGFGSGFFNKPMLEDMQRQKVKDEGADHAKTLRAEGLVWGRTVLYESTATWSEKTGSWDWSTHGTETTAESFLTSKRLQATLQNLGAARPR